MYFNEHLRMLEELLRKQYRPPTPLGSVLGVPVTYDPYIEDAILGWETINACVHAGAIFVNYPWMTQGKEIQTAIIAHEIGHLINGDLDPVRRLYGPGRHTEMEVEADKRAVMLTCKNDVLAYLYLIRDQQMKQRRNKFKWSDSNGRTIRRSLYEVDQRINVIRGL